MTAQHNIEQLALHLVYLIQSKKSNAIIIEKLFRSYRWCLKPVIVESFIDQNMDKKIRFQTSTDNQLFCLHSAIEFPLLSAVSFIKRLHIPKLHHIITASDKIENPEIEKHYKEKIINTALRVAADALCIFSSEALLLEKELIEKTTVEIYQKKSEAFKSIIKDRAIDYRLFKDVVFDVFDRFAPDRHQTSTDIQKEEAKIATSYERIPQLLCINKNFVISSFDYGKVEKLSQTTLTCGNAILSGSSVKTRD